MPKKQVVEVTIERNIIVKAKINLKYDKDVIKIGEKFLVREADVETIKDYVEVVGKIEKNEDKDTDQNKKENDDSKSTEE